MPKNYSRNPKWKRRLATCRKRHADTNKILGCGLDLCDSGWKKMEDFFKKHKQCLGFQCIGLFLNGLIIYYPLNMSVLHTATEHLFYFVIRFLVI